MSLQTLLHRQYSRLITMWPRDHLRPLSLPDTLDERLNFYFGHAAERDSTLPTQSASHTDKSEQERPVIKFEPEMVEKEMNIIASMLENRYKSAYKLDEAVLKPTGSPDYYKKLIQEIDEAPGRGFMGRLVNRWTGWIRMK